MSPEDSLKKRSLDRLCSIVEMRSQDTTAAQYYFFYITLSVMKTKKCIICNEEKSLEKFGKLSKTKRRNGEIVPRSKSGKIYYTSYCYSCSNKKYRDRYRESNPEKLKKYQEKHNLKFGKDYYKTYRKLQKAKENPCRSYIYNTIGIRSHELTSELIELFIKRHRLKNQIK